jgi:hypothetical protein
VVRAAPCGAGVEVDFSHAGTTSTRAFGVDAAFMLRERHELGIHAVWAGAWAGSPVAGVRRERRGNQERGLGTRPAAHDQLRPSGTAARPGSTREISLSAFKRE